jgi:protein-tyrosine-phosphatase
MNKSAYSVAVTLLVGAQCIWGQQPSRTSDKVTATKVVFVCEHGAAKSIIAAAEFERMAKEKGLSVIAVSRGTTPDAEIGAAVRQGLLSDGINIGSAKPVKISANDLDDASKVVSFGPDLMEWLPKGAKAADWSATPSPSENYQAARLYIVKQLESLIVELEKASKAK